MRDDLKIYYTRELAFLREMGAEFAEKYPRIASRLMLAPDACADPHVERLLEGFAFLAARVHLKIDDEFPEITDALLNILYPHYLRPIPATAIAKFDVQHDQLNPETGLRMPRGAVLNSKPVGGLPCRFRTCYDMTFWPVTIANAAWTTPDRLQPAIRASDANGAIRLQLECSGETAFRNVGMKSLRFHLTGSGSLPHTLYELLSNNCIRIVARDLTPASKVDPIVFGPEALSAAGFAEDESLLPYTRRSFAGYRLLQEYFCFAQKFLFFDLTGFDRLRAAGFGSRVEIVFLISPFEGAERRANLETEVGPRTFLADCVPIVNLFEQTAEPILLDHLRYEYHVVPDVSRRLSTEVFSVESVVAVDPNSDETSALDPFYSYSHRSSRDPKRAFWYATRRASGRRNDEGGEVYLSVVDFAGRLIRPDFETLTVRTICTNRDLPSRLPFGNEDGDFEFEGAAPLNRIVALGKLTDTFRPPLQKDARWRLISALSLNYLSLVEEGADALREVLRLYNFTGAAFADKQIDALVAVDSRRQFARVASENGVSFARGTLVEVTLDEEQFTGAGVFLFAAVLERFLGLYAGLNSFSQLSARTLQRRERLKRWLPRAGQRVLL